MLEEVTIYVNADEKMDFIAERTGLTREVIISVIEADTEYLEICGVIAPM